ncbi:proprotein convertase P-domain-containing protein [bacterium]|nr:proprotein convertase P-domain-containing protein [bacterium]
MRSKTLFVWLLTSISLLAALVLPQQANAQINVDPLVNAVCVEDPATTPNNIIDELGDVLTLTARAAYFSPYCDSVDVGLDPNPDLGVLIPALYPTIIINCPSGLTNSLYEMSYTLTDNTGLDGAPGTDPDSCLIVATLTFHPEGVAVAAGTPLQFGITWFGFANTPPPGGQATHCADAGYTIAAPCSINSGCAFIQYAEYGGFAFDGIAAIRDSIWLDSALAVTMDSLAGGDTLVWDASGVTCNGAVDWRGTQDTVEIVPCSMENEFDGCAADTIFLIRFEWDAAGGDVFPDDATPVDTFYCIRQIDNLPPVIDIYCVDSCQVINGNYMDNDTLVGCGDRLRVFMSTTQAAQGKFPANCDGDSVSMTYSYEPNRVDCDQTSPNFDVLYLAVDLSELVPDGFLFPMNEDSINLLSKDSVWVSDNFGTGPDPAGANDIIWVDIPICVPDPTCALWDSIQLCLFDAFAAGDSIRVCSIDDAGNTSNEIAAGYEAPDPDPVVAIEGWDVCLDNQPPDLPGQEIYWSADGVDNYCNQRFSPYDSALATYYTNLSPDSIRWYLDGVEVDSIYDTTSTFDILTRVYLIGFDVRTIPDDDPDTPSGNIITALDYYHPMAEPDSSVWEWRNYLGTTGACFVWYGKDGPDSLDADLDILADYCPWGMLVGITEARYMDAGGCNAILGSDHDGITDILDGYTQLNALYAVVDSCFPTTTIALDIDTTNGPALPIGPDYGSVIDPYLWVDGDDNPWLQFKARRWYTQGLLDTCLAEDLCYTIRLDSIYTQGPWPFGADSVIYYDHTDGITGDFTRQCQPLQFFFNDINTDTISFEWGMQGPGGSPLPDGLYCLTLELQDNAGNVYRGDQVCMWINGLGPEIDSVAIVNDNLDCNLNFFAGESLCVWIQTDTSAQSVLFDFSCILNIEAVAPDQDSIWVDTPYSTDGATFKRWYACLLVDLAMIDTADISNNDYRIGEYDPDCIDPSDYGIINVQAFDADSNYSQADTLDGTCIIALLGESRCPRIVGPIEFWFFDPDSVFPLGVVDSINSLFAGFDEFGPMPMWNAMSPGSVDSSGAYDAITNPAHDQRHDSIFVRILIDTLSITQMDNYGVPFDDDVAHDTLVLEFRNPNTVENRSRIIRKPLFIPPCTNLDGTPGCEDPDNNTIYDGRLELDEHINALAEFRYQWNGTWFQNAGTDSQMLVPITGQDTIIVSAWTIDGDSSIQIIGPDTIFLICDTTVAYLDVDNDNPEFLEWTGIAPGARDPATHSTATVNNDGWDGDCGFRYAEGDTFQLTVRASEQVHFDPAAYPNEDGSSYGPNGTGDWIETGNWQISLVDSTAGLLIPNGLGYVTVELISVTPESLDWDEWEYTLVGRIYNMPADTFIYNACFVIRGAWDQGANPGRYNEPAFSDAYEEDSFEDTTFCLHLIPCDPWADGCPDVFGPDSLLGWIAPEDTNITVCATIIETCEITDCVPGVHADSIRVVEGDFQRITDDPNPWVVPDSVGDWFLYDNGLGDTLGWARNYYWWLRADSSDLATIWCDGDYLDFEIRFVTWEGHADSMTFDSCVQVDVNEPRWTDWFLRDSTGVVVDQMDFDGDCYDPEDTFTLIGCVTDNGIDCPDGVGIGIDTSMIWADLSQLLQDAAMDSVEPDSVVIVGQVTTVYPYAGAPVQINDLDTAYVFINDPDAGLVADVNVTIIDLEHTFDGDLEIALVSPSGTEVVLSNNNGGAGNDFVNTVFDDEAVTPISAGAAPFTGSFRPDVPLSAFNGEDPNGTWTLVVRDQLGLDEGWVNDWSIEITYYTGAPEEVKVLAYWTFQPDSLFFCLSSQEPWFVFHAAHDMIGHHDRELYLQDTLEFCSDCVPPAIVGSWASCECDTTIEEVEDLYNGFVFPTELPYLSLGSLVSFNIGVVDANHDSSLGLVEWQWADLSTIDTTQSWTESFWSFDPNTDAVVDSAVYFWGYEECVPDDFAVASQLIELNIPYHNGDTIFVNFAISDYAGNVDTVLWPIAIYDSLPPIVDFIYTIGDDSIRGYVSPGDDHIHVYADINGYVNDLVSAPEQVWADFSQFQCDSAMKAAYDTVYANYIEHLGGDNYRAWWGWYPGSWVGNPFDVNYLIPGDTTSLPWDTLSACESCSTWLTGAEGTYDSIWVYVTDPACNFGQHFNVFELSGCDSTTPGLDSVWVWGNNCEVGWISSTPLDSGHIEVWAWMDTTFDELADTLMIDSLQVNLIQLGSPRWDHTNWSTPDFFGGWPVYGTDPTPDSTKWEIINVDGRDRLVGKWLWLTADGLGNCEQVVVPVKSIRQTGLGGSHGYYMDVEYGYARVDTTRPVIYDMRVHSITTSIAETTWVTPNYPLVIDFWAYDTSCDPEETDHVGFDLTHDEGGPGPYISFLCGGILDSLWTWDTTAFTVTWYSGWDTIADPAPADPEIAAHADSICIQFVGQPIYDDSCNVIDLDDLEGCVTAYIEDCLSNPAVPVTKTVTTDDRPPQYVNSIPWGDYTIATGFPGDPDIDGIDSVLVLQNSNYNLDWDSTLFVYVIVDNAPGDTLLSWEKTYIDFTGFMNDPLQYPDSIYYNIDGNHRDSILWVIPLYDEFGGGALFNTNIVSNRYWWHLYLSDSLCNRASFYCVDLDSAISFTIQNWTSPVTGMQLLCDSNTVAGSDSDFVDQFNMDLWNNEKVSPDDAMENLYKIWPYDQGGWSWYSHEDVNQTRFFVFVEDTVLQADGIDNDNDGLFDETGEGVDFYTADLRINAFPQVGHVDSMNVDGVWINYLWFADNFSEGRYNVELYISDIYGHRDTLACGDFALTFFEDETCPTGSAFRAFDVEPVDTQEMEWCWNGEFVGTIYPPSFTADDSLFLGANFDSLIVFLNDPAIFDDTQPGSGVDYDTSTAVDSTNWNNGAASSVRLLDPNGVEVAFVQQYDTSDGYAYGERPLYLVDPTGTALEGHPDGVYTIEVVALDNMGNSCTYNWNFTLDRTCPDIQQFFVAHPGQHDAQEDLFTSWDYVELRAIIDDSLDGIEHVAFDYAFDANRDGEVDAYSYWQTRNIWVEGLDDGDQTWPFAAYWNIRNLTWNNEDTLGLPPVNPDSCLNTWFVRVHAWDKFGNYCVDTIEVEITDDIAPLAYISNVDGDTTPQGYLVPCFEPNVDTDSLIEIRAFDFQGGIYDPLPGDTTFAVFSYADEETDQLFSSGTMEAYINVTDDFSILDVNIIVNDLRHSYVGCLAIELESPTGTIVELTNYNWQGYNDMIGLTFDDEAFRPINDGNAYAPYNGAFRPEELLSAFDGESTLGTWTLRITETCGYEGELNSWSLVITERPIGGLATYQWFDLAKGMFQYKFFEAPGTYVPGNTDPAAGWVTMVTPGQDSVSYRQPGTEDFAVQWNIAGLPSHQYNLRFLSMDVCDNVDALNTPVITVRIECDTTAPMALICFPTEDLCVTNLRCDTTQWVPVQSTAPIMSDVDSIAYFFVDSLSVPGLGIHTFIGGASSADSIVNGWAYYHSTAWNTDNLLSGYYWLYAVAYDDAGLFDTDPIWTRVFVDNTAPQVTECWIGNWSGDYFAPIYTIGEGQSFALRANASDNIGLAQDCGISGVQFQFLDRYGNWRNLEEATDWNEAWGADVYIYPYYTHGFVTDQDANGYYELQVTFYEFGNSPLDSVRFRAIAVDNVHAEGWGDNNWQGDANRDCRIDRDLACGVDVCCSAIEIRDALPEGTHLWCFNHAWFQWGLPQYSAPTEPIFDGDKFSTCNYQNPIDTLLLVANVADYVEDEWLMYFKFWRADGTTDTFDVPNDYTLNPALPRNADSAVVLESTWDSVYVVWTGVRAFLDSADAADGLVYSRWDFAAIVEDLTGNQEEMSYGENACFIYTFCPPNTPITEVSYVTNDVNEPDNRVRVEEAVAWQDTETDTIEVLYNRTTDPGSNDPEALVLFRVDENTIRNCHDDEVDVFNLELWRLDDEGELESLCDESPLVDFDYFNEFQAWDQYPPDNGTDYELGLYFDNSYAPGVYNFAVIVNYLVSAPFSNDTLTEGDTDCDGYVESNDFTKIDIVVRIVNVNEPQVVFCYPNYGDVCGAHNTVPLSANDVSDPNYFTGEITQVAFERWDGTAWVPVIDPVTGVNYDTNPGNATVRFQLDEKEVPGMAGWYYERHSNPVYSWYAERDLFPDVAVYVWDLDEFFPMTDDGNGFWTADIYLNHGDEDCYEYSFVIDANDNNLWEGPNTDRWIDDPRNIDWDNQDPVAYDRCDTDEFDEVFDGGAAFSTLCLCEYVVNFNSLTVGDGHHEFRTVVTWYDGVAYHVIENPAPGDSIHVFFVDNDEPVATHDIEFDNYWLNGGRCDVADDVYFVTDIQPVDGNYNLVVEDICAVIYQVSLTSNPFADSSWVNVDTIYSNDDMGWTEAWPGIWGAINPITDNIDNDGDGLVDETYDVQAGDGRGEENTLFWSRSIVTDHCGNTYCTPAESIWVDVSEPRACITLVGDVEPGVNGNDVVVVPASRDLEIVATNQDYAGFDQSILGVFQYRTLNPIGPWTNIQADTLSNDTVRHIGNTITATWDLLSYFQETGNDPEGWYQLRVIAIDTVNNTDLCDNDVCYITVRLNDIEPAARIAIYQIMSDGEEVASSCTVDSSYYIQTADDPYCITAIFAPTNIDTGLASITFQYAEVNGGVPSNWRNIETIWDPINNGLNGDTTQCVYFQPQPEDVGDQEIFWIRAIVEDYNGNDTSDAVVLYIDALPPTGEGEAETTAEVATACGDRCWLTIDPGQAIIWMDFDADILSGEFNIDQVWLTAVREDSLYSFNFGEMTRSDDDEWYFDFEGDLCDYWAEHRYESGEGGQYPVLDYGCYTFTVHFTDCQGNEDSVVVTTDCGNGATDLVCIDCFPAVPEHTDILGLDYSGLDCTLDSGYVELTDQILDGTTEIGGDQTVTVWGVIPTYEQSIWYMVLYVESQEAGVTETAVDTFWWNPTFNSHNDPSWNIGWWLADTLDDGTAKYPSGYYRVWARAHDAICQIEPTEMLDEFWVHVDHGEPVGDIIQVNGEPVTPENTWIEINAGEDNPATLWVEWTDGLTPDDSTQTNNVVTVWCKNIWHPNQADAWTQCGYIPSPCNPHYVELDLTNITCGDSLHVIAIVQDRWGNGDLDVERVMEAFDDGHAINIYIFDTTPPSSMVWSVGTSEEPWCEVEGDIEGLWIVDQQTNTVSVGALGDIHDIWLHAFTTIGDDWPTINGDVERVYFEYSFDGTTWYEIGVDEEDQAPCAWDGGEPAPWWDGVDHEIFWSVIWDVSGLAGDVWVRSWAQDECGNSEEMETYIVSFDVQAPMAQVFVWEDGVNIDNLETCNDWTEPQVGDSVERFTWLTVGACADETEGDAYGAHWFIKRAEDHPLEMWSWCFIGDDSTGPFSVNDVDLWHNDCPAPQPGLWYDIAVLTTDQAGNELTWTQFLNYGEGTTVEEKWSWLMANGYVKRIYISDTQAPVAHDLVTAPDCTPDSSVIFLHGDIQLYAEVDDEDVVAVTFAFLEVGSNGPWTVIERVEGEPGDFAPVEGHWNTELLNGTYWVGAFAEDDFGNMNGNLTLGEAGAPNALLQVNVDNEAPVATIVSVWRTDDPAQTPVTQLERGAEVTFHIEAQDNFTVRKVRFYYRHTNGEPSAWTQVGGDRTWPFSFNWTVPTDLVVGWTYDFAAVAVDYCEQTDQYDDQGNYIIDWTAPVVDEEANISIVSLNDYFFDVEGTPHIHGTDICIYANSEPTLDHVRFIFVTAAGDTHEIRTVQGNIGDTEWSNCQGSGSYWDVTVLPEGPGQICAIGSADLGGELVTLATDCRNIVIDHSLPWTLTDEMPSSHGLLGGYCALTGPITIDGQPDDIWVHFNDELTDAGLDTVWFEWKWAADPNDDNYWNAIGYAYQDNGLTGNWVYSWDVYNYFEQCGTISLRAVLSDNSVPESNLAYVLFADTVRVDNCPPTVLFTNVNGDLTPDNTVIPWGEIINMVATAEDVFGNGGNSDVDSVCFYGGNTPDEVDLISCDTQGPLWSAQLATTDIGPDNNYYLRVVAWDEAGNCSEHAITIYVEDSQYQRACIVGYDDDNEFACNDYLYAVTDDCDTNWTAQVQFQVSTNQGQSWIPLADAVNTREDQCNDWLGWHLWQVTLEFDLYPANAWFRAVAWDENGNVDPNPAIWRRADVTTTDQVQIWAPDWVRVPSNGEQQPWVLTTLEDYTENCLIEAGVVCIEPEAGSTFYAGELPSNTRPCELEDEDGRITVFTSNKVQQGDNTFIQIVTYAMDIHEANYQGGSNGTLVSEDGVLEVTIPAWGTGWRGSLWFQPYLMSQSHSMVPAYQYYYTLISNVEEIQSDDLDELDIVQPASSFRMRFDNSLLPENAEEWQVVVAYWNWDASDESGMYNGMWQEWGITYNDRDLENGIVDFQWTPDWDISDLTSICPDRVRFGVFLTSIRPIDEFVRMNNGGDCDVFYEDLTYYNGMPVVDCNPLWWVVLGEGEYPPTPDRVDVWLDGIRIVNDGEVAEMDDIEGYEDCYYDELFTTHYDEVSGMYSVQLNPQYYSCPPWFGCLPQGVHTIQFFVDDRPTNVTPFYVDNTPPTAHAEPTYIGDVSVTLWADLIDRESGIDTISVYLDLANCGVENSDYVHEITAEAMTFEPIYEDQVLIGYRASVTVQWDGLIENIFYDWYDDEYPYYSGALECPLTLCAHWHVYNNVCNYNEETEDYRYTVDILPPVITPVSPIGAAIDDDGDGVANEDGVDCENNDGDFFWTHDWGWEPRYDEDPINFAIDTFNCGERIAIQGSISDWARCCYGAAGVNLDGVQWVIDGTMYTIGDTANAGLNFFVNQPGQNDFVFNFGGDASGEAADVFYTPGIHTITMFVPDNAGNIGTTDAQMLSWSWYVACPGPSVEFNGGECGPWFNPEYNQQNPQEFSFVVRTVATAPIAPNGISYTVTTVPSGEIVSGPTTIDPQGQDEVEVEFSLDGSFPDGQTGLAVTVETRNIYYVAGGNDGYNLSSFTYTADGCAPTDLAHFPASDDSVQNEGNVVVEIHYTDDCEDGLFRAGSDVTLTKGMATVNSTGSKSGNAAKSETRVDRDGDGILDDNGSGIITDRVWFVVVPPRGEVLRFEDEEDFIERTISSAKIVLTDPQAGRWTVNAYAEDCVGNLMTSTWTFWVRSTGPVASFTDAEEATCQYNGFWNPDRPLYFAATVQENDGANVNNNGIAVRFVGLYDGDNGIEEVDLTANVTLNVTPAYNSGNTEQTFEVTGNATFGDFGGHGTPTDVRIVLTATDQYGTTTEIVQTWVVDDAAPVVQVLSPLPNSVVNGDLMVTISAHFYDDEDAGAAGMPGDDQSIMMDKNLTPTTGLIGGSMKGGKSDATMNVTTTTRIDMGEWRDALMRGFSSLDGNSGVDPSCIEFRLLNHVNGQYTDLMEGAVINGGVITWTGNLEDGDYTVVLTVCDYVCNTTSEIWSFAVVSFDDCLANIYFLPPFHVSAMPHCFEALVDCDQVDRSTVTMTLEGAMLVDGQLVFAPIVVDAPVAFNGDTATYCANFDLTGLNSIRATLNGNFNGGSPMAPISQLYTVDTGAPIFTNVQPLSDDENPLAVLEPITFRVDFAEVGTVGLDPASVRIWLTAADGTTVPGESNVSIAGNGLTGYATLAFTGLESGAYTLHAEVSDLAGNRATGEWGQRVGYPDILVGGDTYNYPNPFTPEDGYTTFVLPIEEGSGNGAYVSIKIYDFSGRFVATVFEGSLADNNRAITWAGTNDQGEEVANGVYLANVTVTGTGKTVNNIVKVAYKKASN